MSSEGTPESAASTPTQGSEPETVSVEGPSLVAKVKELINEGNVRRIAVKNSDGDTVLEIPVTAGVIGVALLPVFAALGALAGLSQDWTLEVYRRDEAPASAS